MITAYVDGCSYNHNGTLKAGAGVVWLNDRPCQPQMFRHGQNTSQFAELAAILIALETAAQHRITQLLICTDSNYARLSFMCHLPIWKDNGFCISNNKPVKLKDLILACNNIVTANDMHVYWKKVRGHSKLPGPDKLYNDQTDALAKDGALHETPWFFDFRPPTREVSVITRRQKLSATSTALAPLHLTPQFADSDLVALQASDPSIAAMIAHLSDPGG